MFFQVINRIPIIVATLLLCLQSAASDGVVSSNYPAGSVIRGPHVTPMNGLTGKIAFQYRELSQGVIYTMPAKGSRADIFLTYRLDSQRGLDLLGISANGQYLGIDETFARQTSFLSDTTKPAENYSDFKLPNLKSLDFTSNSADGLPAIVFEESMGISILDLAIGHAQKSSVTRWSAEENGRDCHPRWSSDYQSIFYLKVRLNRNQEYVKQIVRKKMNAFDEEVLVTANTDGFSVSPDGKTLAFAENLVLNVFDTTTHTLRKLPIDTNSLHLLSSPVFSPDGRFLAYIANYDPGYNSDWNWGGNIYLLELSTGTSMKWIDGENSRLFWSKSP